MINRRGGSKGSPVFTGNFVRCCEVEKDELLEEKVESDGKDVRWEDKDEMRQRGKRVGMRRKKRGA